MANLYVAHQGSGQDGQLWFTFTGDGSNWAKDQQVPTSGMSDSPSALFFNDRLYCFHQGLGGDGQLWHTSTSDAFGAFEQPGFAQPGFGPEGPDQQVPNVGMSDSPGARVGFNDRLYCFHQGLGGDGQLWYTSTPDGSNWAQDQQVPNAGMSESPSACFG